MPDPTGQTISATEVPALFNASPYFTRWMLYQKFAKGVSIEKPETPRMFWGKQLQPLVLARAARDLKFDVYPNEGEHYVRHGGLCPVGCTRDARIFDPSRGWGSLETKCVFDYRVWMQEWGGGQRVPRHYDIQHQQQMIIGEGDGVPHGWGVIAAWVAGEMFYFERAPVERFDFELGQAVGNFMRDVEQGNEPEPFGDPVELPVLKELFDPPPGAVLDLPDDWKLAEDVRLYADSALQAGFHSKACEALRARLIARARQHNLVLLPGGISYTVKLARDNSLRVKVKVPSDLPDELMGEMS